MHKTKALLCFLLTVCSLFALAACGGGSGQSLKNTNLIFDQDSNSDLIFEFFSSVENVTVTFEDYGVPQTSIIISKNKVSVKNSFIKQLSAGNYNVKIIVSGKEYSATLSLITKEPQAPKIISKNVVFDQLSDSDLSIDIELGNSDFAGLKLFGTLVEQSAFNIEDGKIIIYNSFLKGKQYKVLNFELLNEIGSCGFEVTKNNIIYEPRVVEQTVKIDPKLYNNQKGFDWKAETAFEILNYIKIDNRELSVSEYLIDFDKITLLFIPQEYKTYTLSLSTEGGIKTASLICEDKSPHFDSLSYLLKYDTLNQDFNINVDLRGNIITSLQNNNNPLRQEEYEIRNNIIALKANYISNLALPAIIKVNFEAGYSYNLNLRSDLIFKADFDNESILNTQYFGIDLSAEIVEDGIDGKSAKITNTAAGTLLAIGAERYPFVFESGKSYLLKFEIKLLETLSGVSNVYGDLFMPAYFGTGKDVAYIGANSQGKLYFSPKSYSDPYLTDMLYDSQKDIYSFSIGIKADNNCILFEIPVWMDCSFLIDNIVFTEAE